MDCSFLQAEQGSTLGDEEVLKLDVLGGATRQTKRNHSYKPLNLVDDSLSVGHL